jgi:hypothetical protein
MAIRSYSEKATYCRVAFAGCAGAGKATCMQGLQKKLTAGPQGKVTWVHSPPLGAMWLDLLASKAPNSGWELWINLHGVTGREQDPANEEHARWLLEGMDGVVFVVDSSRARLEDNRLAFASLQRMMAYCRQPPAKTVLLFNKRDLPAAELASVDEIAEVIDPRRELEFAEGAAREDPGCVSRAALAIVKAAIARL